MTLGGYRVSAPEAETRAAGPRQAVRMIEVGDKQISDRRAVARGWVQMKPATLRAVQQAQMPKGDVLTVAQLAGVMAAKRTPELVPLCHPIPISSVTVELCPCAQTSRIQIEAQVRAQARTGVEMEALAAVAAAALCVYDMCKASDPAMEIGGIGLVEKSGGKSRRWQRDRT